MRNGSLLRAVALLMFGWLLFGGAAPASAEFSMWQSCGDLNRIGNFTPTDKNPLTLYNVSTAREESLKVSDGKGGLANFFYGPGNHLVPYSFQAVKNTPYFQLAMWQPAPQAGYYEFKVWCRTFRDRPEQDTLIFHNNLLITFDQCLDVQNIKGSFVCVPNPNRRDSSKVRQYAHTSPSGNCWLLASPDRNGPKYGFSDGGFGPIYTMSCTGKNGGDYSFDMSRCPSGQLKYDPDAADRSHALSCAPLQPTAAQLDQRLQNARQTLPKPAMPTGSWSQHCINGHFENNGFGPVFTASCHDLTHKQIIVAHVDMGNCRSEILAWDGAALRCQAALPSSVKRPTVALPVR